MRKPSRRTSNQILVMLGLWVVATPALAAANYFLFHPDRSFVDALQSAATLSTLGVVVAIVCTRVSDRMNRADRPGR